MKIVVAGGTGFIGTAVVRDLLSAGHDVDVLTRSNMPLTGGARALHWGPGGPGTWWAALAGADAVVNLAGENLARRWSEDAKRQILDSRLNATRAIIEAVGAASHKPAVLVNASAVGFYGPGSEPVDEKDGPGGDFLANVCRAWENEAQKAEPMGLRVVRLRMGIVLGANGGALKSMLPPFRFGLGGRLGSGDQWMSWIHLADVLGLIRRAIEKSDLSGAVNAVAPEARTNREFTRTLGRVLHRPALLPVPEFALRLLLGELADMLLTGQQVVPAKAKAAGFTFRFPELQAALEDCLA